MVVDFKNIDLKEPQVLILANQDGSFVQPLAYAKNIQAKLNYNETSELSFEIPAYVNGEKTPHYDDIVGMRLIEWLGVGRFILVNPKVKNDGVKELKSCVAYSLEYELTYKKTFIEEGTYNFYDPISPEGTILGLLMEDVPSWNRVEVDEELIGRYRTLSANNVGVYDFIKNTLQETFQCIFDFNTMDRSIHVRSVESTVAKKPIYISLNNLAKNIEVDEDTENLFTCLDVNGADGVDIRSVNPSGDNKIYNLDYFMNESYFTKEMIQKWENWKKVYESNQQPYFNLTVEKTMEECRAAMQRAELTVLKGDLSKLEAEQAVYVEAVGQGLKDKQKDLDRVNKDIEAQKTKITNAEKALEETQTRIDGLLGQQKEFNKRCSFASLYTAEDGSVDEVAKKTLDRYIKEDAISEPSFVYKNVASYSTSDVSKNPSGIACKIENCKVSRVDTENKKSLYMITGGQFTLTYTLEGKSETITGQGIHGTIEDEDASQENSKYLATMNLSNIVHGEAKYPKGLVSFFGDAGSITSDVKKDPEIAEYLEGTKIEISTTASSLYITENVSEYEKRSVEWDLYEYGQAILAGLAWPKYHFSVDSANFLANEDFIDFRNQFELGSKVYLDLEDFGVKVPIVIGAEIDFDHLDRFRIYFGDKYSLRDSAFELVDLLDQSISMGKDVSVKNHSYNSFVESGASNKVHDFMSSALDVAKNAILNSSGQAVQWDASGLRLRKYGDESKIFFDDEQIWMVNNSIVFTDNNWNSAKMAIGKIFDTNIGEYTKVEPSDVYSPEKTYYKKNPDTQEYVVFDSKKENWDTNKNSLYYKKGSAYGICAPYIVGTMLAGENLVIDTDNGAFRVDESGVHIDSLKFYITHGGSDSSLDSTLGDIEDSINGLNGKVENSAATYYGETEPEHPFNGDLWYKPSTKELRRYNTVNQPPTWDLINDPNSVTTYEQGTVPENAVEGSLWYCTADITVDGKTYNKGKLYRYNGSEWTLISSSMTTYSQDTPPTSAMVGDLWYCTKDSEVNGVKYKQKTLYRFGPAKDNPDRFEWQEINNSTSTYSQGTVPENPADGDLWYCTENVTSGSITYDKGKIYRYAAATQTWEPVSNSSKTYSQDTVPENPSVGDVWYCTGECSDGTTSYHKKRIYQYTSSGWVEINDETSSYSQGTVPENPVEGDIWYCTADCQGTDGTSYVQGKLYRYNGTIWEKIEDSDIGHIKDDVEAVKTTLQSIITKEGYLDASKMQGVIDSQSAQMKGASGNVLFDSDGLWLMNQPSKETTTKAIWMNERGILLGSGEANADPGSTWKWSTAISADGIVADAIAAGTLSGMNIVGGELHIGGTGTDYAMNVDSDGNATFKGTITASTVNGTLKGGQGAAIQGTALGIGNPGTGDTWELKDSNFYVDQDGNVTMKGNITWSTTSNPCKALYTQTDIGTPRGEYASYPFDQDLEGTEHWHRTCGDADKYVSYSYAGGTAGSFGRPIKFKGEDGKSGLDQQNIEALLAENGIELNGASTTINHTAIYSPTIFGGELYALGSLNEGGNRSGSYIEITNSGLKYYTMYSKNDMLDWSLETYDDGNYMSISLKSDIATVGLGSVSRIIFDAPTVEFIGTNQVIGLPATSIPAVFG